MHAILFALPCLRKPGARGGYPLILLKSLKVFESRAESVSSSPPAATLPGCSVASSCGVLLGGSVTSSPVPGPYSIDKPLYRPMVSRSFNIPAGVW